MEHRGTPRPVSITRLVKGIVEVDDDALGSILKRPEFGDLPIAIISIAGVLRSGKSFLLNFLLRYLRQKGWSNPDWMGDGATKAENGIKWRGGQHPETTGIIVWDEIFELRKTNGKNILLLLMDTQGLFDNNTIKQNNVKLFTLSTLASSVQILNIKELIQERDLENLQLCVEFAMISARQAGPSCKLQSLMVLIRDWANEEENSYGFEGGQQYLNEVLRYRDDKEELNVVRKHLRQSFRRLECFLLPHPGTKVQKASKFKGSNQEIDEDFLEQLSCFVPTLLHPDSIVCKEGTFGEPLTARALLRLIASADKSFVDGKIPKVEILLKAQAKAHYCGVYETAIKDYDDALKHEITRIQGQAKGPITEEQLAQCGKKAMGKALSGFDSTVRIGLDETRNRYRKNAQKTCGEHFRTCEESNKNELEKIRVRLQRYASQFLEEYQHAMKQAIGKKAFSEKELKQLHKKFSDTALSRLQSVNEAKYKSIFRSYESGLQKSITGHFTEFEEINYERLAAKQAEKRVQELLQMVDDYAEEHEKKLEECIQKYQKNQDFYSESSKITKRLEDEFKIAAPDASSDYIAKLKNKFVKNVYQAVGWNEMNLEMFAMEANCFASEKRVEYKRHMEQEMAGEYIEEEALKNYDKKFSETILDSVAAKFSGYPSHMIEQAKDTTKNKLSDAFKEVEEINANNKSNRVVHSQDVRWLTRCGRNLTKQGGEEGSILKEGGGRLVQGAGTVVDATFDTVGVVGHGVGKGVGTVVDVTFDTVAAAGHAVGGVGKGVGAAVDATFGTVAAAGHALGGAAKGVGGVGKGVGTVVDVTFDTVAAAGHVVGGVGRGVGTVVDTTFGTVASAGHAVGGLAASAVGGIASLFK